MPSKLSSANTQTVNGDFYKLNVATLPDEMYRKDVSAEKWLEHASAAGKPGFPPNSLNQLSPLDPTVEVERIVGIALYMAGNVLPFALPILLVCSMVSDLARYITAFVAVYIAVLWFLDIHYFTPIFAERYQSIDNMKSNDIFMNQYLFSEYNNCKYLSVNFVWPKSMHPPTMKDRPLIFCAVPHGVAPFGITAYPLWSKLWNSKLCHWTAAPVVLKIPIVSYYMKKIGYIPAKAKDILETLTKKEENVGIILDGIEGMFQPSHEKQETVYILKRKGIVKIALRAGATIVPVYGFGHTDLYTVVVDPFGILKYLSRHLNTALTPFFGRYGWFLGPPRRIPVTMCLGDPIVCPQIDEPTKEDIDKHHQLMVEGFENVFNQHKAAYGWPDKKLHFL